MQIEANVFNTGENRSSTLLLHQQAIERVISMMRERLREPLSLEDMADIANLSPYHFSRIFHRLIGVPPGEFLTALRLDAAKRLLLTTSLSVTDICFEVGYTSLGSFTTRFTQLVGLPPRQLRQAAQDFAPLSFEPPGTRGIHTFCFNPFRSRLFGTIRTSTAFTGVIFVGLFPKPIPQGRPIRCTILPKPGHFSIGSIPDGCYYVLAATLPLSEDCRDYCSTDSRLLVGMNSSPLLMCNGMMQEQADILLHPPRLIDPPVVVALPFI